MSSIVPPKTDFNPPAGVNPGFEQPHEHIDDNQSVSSVDDFEARLNALKKL
jgi:hypothetical protein